MTVDLKGKTALVTGSGRGIGKSIAIALAEAGAEVAVAARTSQEVEKTVSEIGANGGKASAMTADISSEEDVRALFDRIRNESGKLDILVNNAGIGIYGRVDQVSAEDIDNVLGVNLKGTFLCCREAMNMMMPCKSGYIINISSVVGFRGYENQGVYTASKHGVMGLTKTLAVEAQEHGVRVSAILPGGVDTEMVRRARPDLDTSVLLYPEDIAGTVLYLLSLSDRAAVDQIYIRRWASKPF